MTISNILEVKNNGFIFKDSNGDELSFSKDTTYLRNIFFYN